MELKYKNYFMYTYRRTESSLWTVGYYDPNGRWEPESDWDSPAMAANRVTELNGGSPLNKPLITLLFTALDHASSVIKQWHGPESWDIYYSKSPEMKIIRETLALKDDKS